MEGYKVSLDKIFSAKTNSDVKREIILELLNSDKNLDEKTELSKPMKWATIRTIEDYLAQMELPKSANILSSFVEQSHKFLISKARKGRKEYIQALGKLGNELEEKPKESLVQ